MSAAFLSQGAYRFPLPVSLTIATLLVHAERPLCQWRWMRMMELIERA
ncbi:hypothetical protein ACPOL_0758 [Acidisarcina polymorpha]|uniref:Uncharacterized protein n=1 Tax=Acidisarcina polymorpha TaxID=2211140 RepID=A0A2Z5FTE8_9BACT|nr:hypothetical protein ACPOL_0758 [Acidisarcina polymorpha]